MPNRLKRASVARLIVGMAVMAFPLLATGVAQASIAGAAPASAGTTGPPNLVSATVIGGNQVNVCFDRTVQLNTAGPGSGQTSFALAGYRSDNDIQSTAANTNNTNANCVIVTFGGTAPGQIDKFTVLTVATGAVTSNATGSVGEKSNAPDSVTLSPLSGATDISHDGTTGVTTAPNLVSISAPSASQQPPNGNSLTFNFDRNTTAPAANAGDFFMVEQSGDICRGTSLTGSGSSSITVTFGVGAAGFAPATCNIATLTSPTDTVVNAFQGGLTSGAVTSVQDPDSSNTAETARITGQATTVASQHPVLASATLDTNDLDNVIFTFDRPIEPPAGGFSPAAFEIGASDGVSAPPILVGQTAVQINQYSVEIGFNGNLASRAEYAVIAFAAPGAVDALGGGAAQFSVPGSSPVGGNAGAVSYGFTTAPDVTGVNISGSGLVTVVTDQRVGQDPFFPFYLAVNTGDIQLLSPNGEVVTPSTPPAVSENCANPGPCTIYLQYSPLTNTIGGTPFATMVAFGANALHATLDPVTQAPRGLAAPLTSVIDDSFSVPQIVTSTANAGKLKALKVEKKTKKTTKKAKHTKKAKKTIKK